MQQGGKGRKKKKWYHWVELLEEGNHDLVINILVIFKVVLWEKALTCSHSLSLSLSSCSFNLPIVFPTHSHFFLNTMHSSSIPCASSLQILVSYDLRSYSTITPSDTPTPNHPRTGEYRWDSYLNTKKTRKQTQTTATPPTESTTFQQELHHYDTPPLTTHLSQSLQQNNLPRQVVQRHVNISHFADFRKQFPQVVLRRAEVQVANQK